MYVILFVFTAVLFQDAVILGAANEPMPLECTSPAPTSLSPQAFPFCTLERTVSNMLSQSQYQHISSLNSLSYIYFDVGSENLVIQTVRPY